MTQAAFDFDEEIDRREVPALKPHRSVLGAGREQLFPAGVADMDFKASPPVLEAMAQRLQHGIFGYEAVPDGLLPALTNWLETRHGWRVDPGPHSARAQRAQQSFHGCQHFHGSRRWDHRATACLL